MKNYYSIMHIGGGVNPVIPLTHLAKYIVQKMKEYI